MLEHPIASPTVSVLDHGWPVYPASTVAVLRGRYVEHGLDGPIQGRLLDRGYAYDSGSDAYELGIAMMKPTIPT